MAKALTTQQVVDRWAARGAASGDTVTRGVNAVTDSPTEKAAQAKQRWIDGVNRAAQSGRYEQGLRRVTLQEWRDAMIKKGVPNMVNGYTNGKAKFQRFMETFLPYVREGAARVRAMPKGTIDQSIARAAEMIRHNARFRSAGVMAGGAGGAILGGVIGGL